MNDLIRILNPILPKRFDENETYIIVIATLVTWICLYVQKRYKPIRSTEYLSLFLLNAYLAVVGEAFLAEPPLDLYDTVDKPKAEIADIILQIFVYPPTIIIAMQYYAYRKPQAWYPLVFAGVLTLLEWISIEAFHLFQYKKWNIYYSYFLYVIVMVLNILFFNKIHAFINKKDM
ncbi:CBO0543 family protein [Pontibacillus marinus]|uniref:Uncharacterized protein n=1 Tax=Pontibacillus marinus BH030004 = DSM 16465 TaxID=1385511 RepID=A0A0A5G459_9BACI|nr:CBO0543 family protein [Pontibacillus marinus]KGX85918.1 hypothetical protein N783_13075 [Pontibacillus marinus BH030004 = DSM 16465]